MKSLSVLALLPLLAFPVPPALAQTGLDACVSQSQDAARLACYDALFRQAGPHGDALAVTIQSQQLIPARPSGRAPATMTITCTADVLAIAFAFAGNTMSALGRDAPLTLQSDLQPARSRTLPVDPTNTAILLDNTADAVTLLDSLAGSTNLTVRVTPVNSRSLSVRFPAPTILAQAQPVRSACGV